MYRRDSSFGKDSSVVAKTGDFNLPLKRNRAGKYKLSGNETVYICFTSDFFLEEADEWRAEAWQMSKELSSAVNRGKTPVLVTISGRWIFGSNAVEKGLFLLYADRRSLRERWQTLYYPSPVSARSSAKGGY